MAVGPLPAINQDACTGWNPVQMDLYNSIPGYMFKREVKFRQRRGNWKRIFGTMDWEPNKGSTLTGVVEEPPPQKRQFAFPVKLSVGAAKKDITIGRERTFDVSLAHHKFESPIFQWLSSFEQFIGKKVTKNLDYVLKQQEDFQVLFYRGNVFHQSPAVYFCGGSDPFDDGAPVGDGNEAGTSGKSLAYLQAKVNTMSGNNTNLSLRNVFSLLNILEEDIGAPPYESGSAKDDSFLNDKYLLLTSGEVWNGFIDDPWLKENKDTNLNLVTEGFKGSLFGRVTTATFSNPLRFYRDADGVISWPEPETIEENPDAENFGQTLPSPTMRAAQYEVSFLCGSSGYDIVNPGAPPGEFAQHAGLKWNGRPMITDKIAIPCEGSDVPELNEYGEFLKIISMAVMGIAGVTKKNVVPIIHKRKRFLTTAF